MEAKKITSEFITHLFRLFLYPAYFLRVGPQGRSQDFTKGGATTRRVARKKYRVTTPTNYHTRLHGWTDSHKYTNREKQKAADIPIATMRELIGFSNTRDTWDTPTFC